jgi:hypothetical protein
MPGRPTLGSRYQKRFFSGFLSWQPHVSHTDPTSRDGYSDTPDKPAVETSSFRSGFPAAQPNGSRIFFSITASVTESVEMATPILGASSVKEIRRGTSK